MGNRTIWRTVVVAGAMLGQPLAHADKLPDPPPAKPNPNADLDAKIGTALDAVAAAQTETDRKAAIARLKALQAQKAAQLAQNAVVKLGVDLADLAKRVDAAVNAVVAAQSDADRSAAKAKLDSLRVEKASLEKKLAAEKAKLDAVDRLVVELADLDAQIALTVDAVAAAQTEADRKAALARLDANRRIRAMLAQRLADRAKRPRANDDRPVGRGFVLA